MIHGVTEKLETHAGEVSVRLDGDGSGALLVLAHGAGAGMDHPFMQAVAEGLATRGVGVLRFNFPYCEQGRKAPDRQSVLERTFGEIAAATRATHAPRLLFLGGKSMGGRIASHVAASGEPCHGVVFLGYPLHPPGRPDRIRDAHLYDLEVPMLFVEGTRDPFCPLERLGDVRARLRGANDLLVIEDGDHSFRVRNSSGRSNADALDELVQGTVRWIERQASIL